MSLDLKCDRCKKDAAATNIPPTVWEVIVTKSPVTLPPRKVADGGDNLNVVKRLHLCQSCIVQLDRAIDRFVERDTKGDSHQ
jgi:hypothetical protein